MMSDIGQHWLEVVHERIVAGENETDVLKDYGYESSRSASSSIAIEDIELDDVLAWADGIQGALGTEHASKVTHEEARISWAIVNAPR